MENTELITKAIEYIQKNPKDNLTLQSIADRAGFSLTYFDYLFTRHTGYGAVEYSRVFKLTRAALDLRRTENPVLDIALDYGYSGPENFTRAFKSFYGITPSDYRIKYSKNAVTWDDLSSGIGIRRFAKAFPELHPVDMDTALDFMFTHNPVLYAEEIANLTVTCSSAFTLGDPREPGHFVYASDYHSACPVITIVCTEEKTAIDYVRLLSRIGEWGFSIRMDPDWEWNSFHTETAKRGFVCQCGVDMIYPGKEIEVPLYDGMTVHELTVGDMPTVRRFKENGGCAECHVKGLQAHFDGKNNPGERGFGLFIDGEMVCLATPVLDTVREMRKYDIGAIFAIGKGNDEKAIEMIWKYVINACLKDGCIIGNGNAYEDDTPLSIAESEKIGLVKIAKNFVFRK